MVVCWWLSGYFFECWKIPRWVEKLSLLIYCLVSNLIWYERLLMFFQKLKVMAILILLFREFHEIGKIPWNSHIVLLLCWIISREFYDFGEFPWSSVKVRAIPLRIFWEFCKIRKIPSNSHIVLNQPMLLSCQITLHFSKGSYLNTVQIQDYMCWFTLLNLCVLQKKYSLIQVSTFWSMIWFKPIKISHF